MEKAHKCVRHNIKCTQGRLHCCVPQKRKGCSSRFYCCRRRCRRRCRRLGLQRLAHSAVLRPPRLLGALVAAEAQHAAAATLVAGHARLAGTLHIAAVQVGAAQPAQRARSHQQLTLLLLLLCPWRLQQLLLRLLLRQVASCWVLGCIGCAVLRACLRVHVLQAPRQVC